MAEKTVAFLVARLSSSRMAGKHFRSIGDKPMINWIIDQLKTCREIDGIVIATVAEPCNEGLRELAEKEDISCYWYDGEVDHVTTRLCEAAQHYEADICLLISGDCPLIYGPAIDILLESFKKDSKANVLCVDKMDLSSPPALYGVEIARREAWVLGEELSDKPELKEHHFPAIGMNLERFAVHHCFLPKHLYAPLQRLFVDTWADFEFLNTLYDELVKRGQSFSLPNVLNLLGNHQELQAINKHVHQRRLKEDIKGILFVVDAGESFGYGHLMRSLELGLQIVERLSWPVSFLVDDPYARELIEGRGLKVLYGALHRSTQATTDMVFDWDDVKNYDLVVLDLADRPIPSDWRPPALLNIPVVVLDKMQRWCEDSELIVIPGVTAPSQKIEQWHNDHKVPRILAGQEYMIIRREIRYAEKYVAKKEFDLLIYVHDEDTKKNLQQSAMSCGLTVCTVDGSNSDFPLLLAKSRYYLGDFGHSFYEALFLSTFPITLPGKQSHIADAKQFYSSFGLTPFILDSAKDFAEQWRVWGDGRKGSGSEKVEDGTPALVRELTHCLKTTHRKRER